MAAILAVGPSRAPRNVTFRIGHPRQPTPPGDLDGQSRGLLRASEGLKLEVIPMAGGRDMADAFATGRIDA